MADISKTSEQSLNNILDKLGVRTQEDVKKEGNKNTLGQEDFLKLMTTNFKIKIRLLQWITEILLHRWLNFQQ